VDFTSCTFAQNGIVHILAKYTHALAKVHLPVPLLSEASDIGVVLEDAGVRADETQRITAAMEGRAIGVKPLLMAVEMARQVLLGG
jgi:hypothetical protein